jgi:hypothetical protein
MALWKKKGEKKISAIQAAGPAWADLPNDLLVHHVLPVLPPLSLILAGMACKKIAPQKPEAVSTDVCEIRRLLSRSSRVQFPDDWHLAN